MWRSRPYETRIFPTQKIALQCHLKLELRLRTSEKKRYPQPQCGPLFNQFDIVINMATNLTEPYHRPWQYERLQTFLNVWEDAVCQNEQHKTIATQQTEGKCTDDDSSPRSCVYIWLERIKARAGKLVKRFQISSESSPLHHNIHVGIKAQATCYLKKNQWYVNLVLPGSCQPCTFIAMFGLKQSWCPSCRHTTCYCLTC